MELKAAIMVLAILLIALLTLVAIVNNEARQVIAKVRGRPRGSQRPLLPLWRAEPGCRVPDRLLRAYMELCEALEILLARVAPMAGENVLGERIVERVVEISQDSARQMQWASSISEAFLDLPPGWESESSLTTDPIVQSYQDRLEQMRRRMIASTDMAQKLLLQIAALPQRPHAPATSAHALIKDKLESLGLQEEIRTAVDEDRVQIKLDVMDECLRALESMRAPDPYHGDPRTPETKEALS